MIDARLPEHALAAQALEADEVRAYGLYSASHKGKLEQARSQLGKPIAAEPISNPEDKSAVDQEEPKQKRCPICNDLLEVEPLEFDEAVRPWNVYRAKRINRCERSPPNVEELAIA